MSLKTRLINAKTNQIFSFSNEPDEKRTSLIQSRTHKIIEIMFRLSKDDKTSEDNHELSLVNLFISKYQSLNSLIANLCFENKHLGVSNLIDRLSNAPDMEGISINMDNLMLYRMHRNMICFCNNYKPMEESFYLNAIEAMNNLVITINNDKLAFIKLLNQKN